mgnify:CR=1 FL=1
MSKVYTPCHSSITSETTTGKEYTKILEKIIIQNSLSGDGSVEVIEVSLPAPVRGPPGIRGRGEDDELSLTKTVVNIVILYTLYNHVFRCSLKREDKKKIQ